MIFFTFGMKGKVLCGFILLSSYFVLLSASCPAQCSCTTETKKVNCKGKLITDVPSGIPKDTETLELSECQIKNISMDSFKNLTNLKFIFLTKQKYGLNLQDAEIFQGLQNLEWVYLDENGITSLPGGLFANLSKLNRVHLNNNPIKALPDDLFQNSPNLEYLYVANTKLSSTVVGEIGEGKYASNIKGLVLQGTAIQNFKSGFFSGLPKLETIVVKNCQINYIQQDVLKGTKIADIDFGENPIKSIDVNAFRGDNPTVKNFKCARCNLTSAFQFGFLKNMPSLFSLNLEDNKISHIQKGLFTGLKVLRMLDLSNNIIETIEKDSFADFQCTDQSCILLGDNPLNCDCNLAWFYDFSKKWSDQKFLKCKRPEKVAGKTFADLDVSDFSCLNGTKCGTNAAMVVSAHVMVAVVAQLFLLFGIPLILV